MIQPSPAVVVRADTPIADCVQLMIEHGVGSVLVVSDDIRQELLGFLPNGICSGASASSKKENIGASRSTL